MGRLVRQDPLRAWPLRLLKPYRIRTMTVRVDGETVRGYKAEQFAQVRLLRARLPIPVEVGTVDKFQGREAVTVFYSMVSPSGEDVPRTRLPDVAEPAERGRLAGAMPRVRRVLAAAA
jgi:hypothetical protein